MKDKSTILSQDEIDINLNEIDGWRQEGKYIKKDFVFLNYQEINKFLPYLTKTIVEHNHHPDFSFDSGSRKVTIQVTTHSKGGITNLDLNLARTLNDWATS